MTDSSGNISENTSSGTATTSDTTTKLLLIDHRIKDIDVIINSTNENTYCLVFNYYHDTYDTILSKVRFLNNKNRYINDHFYYEEPTPPTQMDASGNHCTPCDDFDMDSFQLLPSTLYAEHLAYTMTQPERDASGTPTTTAWPFYSESSNIRKDPVFFQRSKMTTVVVPVETDASSTDLSGDELTLISSSTVGYAARPLLYVNNLDAIYNLAKDANEVSSLPLVFDTIGVIQHANFNKNGYKLLNTASLAAQVTGVENIDPQLESWLSFATFIQQLKTTYGMTTLDLMACALYADPDWKYIIDTLAVQNSITIRASNDNTGTSLDGGNWVLETNDINLTTVYFTPEIYTWKYVLATYVDNRFYALQYNNSMYANRAYDARFKIVAGTANFTIETWYYETSAKYNSTIVDMGDYNYTFQVRNANLGSPVGMSFYNASYGDWMYAESAVVPVAQWSHIAITRSGSTFTFYINGVARQTFSSSASFVSNNSTFAIGMQSPDSCSCNLQKDGNVLYDLRLWNVTRTASEIQMYRNRILPNNTAGLVANYLCNDNTSTFTDRINGLNLTIQNYNSARWSNAAVTIPNIGFLINAGYSLTTYNGTALNALSHFGEMTYTDFSGVNFSGVNFTSADLRGSNFTNCNFTNANFTNATLIDTITTGAIFTGANMTNVVYTNATCLQFDGADDAVNIGVPAWTYSTQFRTTMTVECWFKTTDTNNQKIYTTLLGRNVSGGVSSTSQFSIYMLSTGEIGLGLTNAADAGSYHTTTATYKDALWHHVAATYDSVSGAKIIYIDGVLSRTDAVPGGFGLLSNNSTVKLVFGSDAHTIDYGSSLAQFRGYLSDIRIWNVVRSAADISNNYRQRLIGNETGLVGYWELNQGSGTGWGSYSTALDNTSNRSHGTLVGFSNPSANWVISGLSFSPRISNITLGPNNGVYNVSDSSFSFIDPSSNSQGNFTYAISSGAVATISNGAATTKTIYATSGAITIPTLSLYEFPEIASLSSWQIDISFTVTGGAGTWRALIGDMYNEINSFRGWGMWVSAFTPPKIHWSWNNATIEPDATLLSLNIPYLLTAAQSGGVITLTLRNMSGTYNNSLSISNLVASYNFDSNANDSSVNGNTLTNLGSVTYNTTDYKRGTAAASFNGSNYFERANDGRFSPDNFTVALWIKAANSAGSYQSIVTCRNGFNLTGWMIYINGINNLEFITGNGGSVWSYGSDDIFSGIGTINTWVHIAFTVTKSTNSVVAYINGTVKASFTRLYSNNTAYPLRIGAGGDYANELMVKNGTLMDDFRFYNKVLIASEINSLVSESSFSSSFSMGTNVIGKGPVTIGGWRTNSGENFSGTISYANVSVPTNQRVVTLLSSTGGTPATITGTQAYFSEFSTGTKTASLVLNSVISPTIGTMTDISKTTNDISFAITIPESNSTGAFSFVSGTPGVATINPTLTVNALNFDGTNDFVDLLSNITEMGKGSFTIECWVKTTGNSMGILNCQDADSAWESGEKSFYINSSGYPTFVGFGNDFIYSNKAINDGLWHHIAVAWAYSGSGTSGTGYMYIDGQDNNISNLSFVGNNTSYIRVPYNSALIIGTADFTIEWYQYQTDSNGAPRVFEFNNSRSPGVSLEGGRFYWWSAFSTHNSAATTWKNTWVHFAVVRISGSTTIYRNGVSILTFSDTTNYTTSSDLIIGCQANISEYASLTSFGGYIQYFHFIKGVGKYTGAFTPSTTVQTVTANTVVLINNYKYSGTLGSTVVNNNVSFISSNNTYVANNNNTGTFVLGKPNNSESVNHFNGSMCELRIWNIARTNTQIYQNYRRILNGNETGLVAYLRLNQGTAGGSNTGIITATNNMITGGYAGTLTNFGLTAGSTSNWVSGINILPVNDVTIIGGGSTLITATQETAGIYTSGTKTLTLTVINAPILSNFNAITKTYGDASFNLVDPSSNSVGAFTFTSSNNQVATIVGRVVTIIGPGTSTITATQGGTIISASLVVAFGNLSSISKNILDGPFVVPTPISNVVTTYGSTWSKVGSDIVGNVNGDESGTSLSISADGTVVAIGARSNTSNRGTVRVYKYNNVSWTQMGSDITGEASSDYSGQSVSLSANGTIVAIGANYNDGNSLPDSGHVRIYEFNGSSWVQRGGDIDGEASSDQSGISVSLSEDGTVVAIGAILNDGSGNLLSNSGHVRVYKYNAWKTTSQLTNQSLSTFGPVGWDRLGADIDGEAVDDQSGFSLSISANGTIVAIGAIFNDGTSGTVNTGDNRGHIRVYKYNSSKTDPQLTNQSLSTYGPAGWDRLGADIDGEASADQTGFSVSLSADGTTVAFGSPFYDAGGVSNSGRVRVFAWNETSWVQRGGNINGVNIGENLGDSVSLSADGMNLSVSSFMKVVNYNYSSSTSAWTQIGTNITGNTITNVSIVKNALTYSPLVYLDATNSSSYNGSTWTNLGSLGGNISTSGSSTTLSSVYSALSPYLSEFKNSNFYEYTLDGDSYQISDGGGDMYDGGNYTQVRVDGTNSSNLSYSQTTATTTTVSGKSVDIVSLGYARPLTTLAFCSQRANIGMAKYGNIGADGGGSQSSSNVYTGSVLNGYTVYAWVRVIYNAGDPSVGDLYFVLGNSSTTFFSSTMNTYADSSTDGGTSYMTMDCQNAFVGAILLSKPSGTFITVQECQAVLTSLTNRLPTTSSGSIPFDANDNGGSFIFNGSTTTATLNVASTTLTSLTYVAVVKTTGSNMGWASVIDFGNDNLLFGTSANIINFYNPNVNSGFTLTAGVWYFIAVTIATNGNIVFYVNGSSVFSSAGTAINRTNTVWGIGHGVPNSELWNGRISSLAIYNRELTGAEIASLYNYYETYKVSLSSQGNFVAIGAREYDGVTGTSTNIGATRIYKIDSSGNYTYTINNTAIADICGNIVLPKSAGSTTMTVTQSASGANTSKSATIPFSINKISSTLGALTIPSKNLNDPPFTLTAPTSSISSIISQISAITSTASVIVTPPDINPLVYGNSWAKLGGDIDGEAAGDNSGYSVSISADGNVIAVGGRFNDGSGNELPNAFYLRTGGSNWRDYIPLLTANSTTNLLGWSPDAQFNDVNVAPQNEIAKQFAYFAGYWLNRTRATSGQSYSIPAFTSGGSVGTFTFTATSNYPVTSYTGNLSGYNATTYTLTGQTDGNTAGQNVAYQGDIGHVRVYRYNSAKAAAQLNQGLSGFGPAGWDRLGGDIDGEAAGDQSGISVSISANGTVIAIGANSNGAAGVNAGHVRVYKFNSAKTTANTLGPAGWDKLGGDIDGEAAGDQSGGNAWNSDSVKISADGTTVAIAALSNDGNGADSGHVRVYKYNSVKVSADGLGPAGWDKLGADIDGEAAYDYSGYAIGLSADGTIVAIGAYGNDGNGDSAGHVRVYKYTPTKTLAVTVQTDLSFGPIGWNRLGADIDGEAASDRSGTGIALSADGTTVAIGSHFNTSYTGHVRVYKYTPSKTVAVTNQTDLSFGPIGWNRLGADIDGEAGGDFSAACISLSADGTVLAIGANENDGTASNAGHVRIYKYTPSKTVAVTNQSDTSFGPIGWNRLGADIDGEAADDQNGQSVALSSDGTTVVIGARYNDGTSGNTTDNRGHARVYKISTTNALSYTSSNSSIADVCGNLLLIKGVNGTSTITASQTGNTINGNLDISGSTYTLQYNPFTYTSSNSAVATVSTYGTVSIVGLGTTTITATQPETLTYASRNVSASFTINTQFPTLTNFNAMTKTFGDASFNLVDPSSNSVGAFTFTSSNPAVATIVGRVVTILAVGTSTITASQDASGNFTTGSTTALLTVNTRTPTLTNFATLNTFNVSYSINPLNLVNPTSDSSGAFTYSINVDASNIASVVGSVVTLKAVGTATITATQEASGNYTSGSTSATLTISLGTPIFIRNAPYSSANITKNYGDGQFTLVASSDSSGAITYSSNTPSVASINSSTGVVTVGVLGTAIITVSQAATNKYNALTNITWTIDVSRGNIPMTGMPSTLSVNITAVPFTLTATGGNGGAITYSSNNTAVASVNSISGLVTLKAPGTVSIIALQEATTLYNSTTFATVITVIGGGSLLAGQVVSTTRNFSGMDLSGVSFAGSTISSISFVGASIAYGDLSGAIIVNTDFTNTNIYGTNITNVSFSLVQKIQLLKNPNNRNIVGIQLTEVSGNTISPLVPQNSELLNVENFGNLSFKIVLPFTSPSPTVLLANSTISDVSGAFYMPINDNEYFQINNVKYYVSNSLVKNYSTNETVELVASEGKYFKVYAGSFAGVQVDLNTFTVKNTGLGSLMQSNFNRLFILDLSSGLLTGSSGYTFTNNTFRIPYLAWDFDNYEYDIELQITTNNTGVAPWANMYWSINSDDSGGTRYYNTYQDVLATGAGVSGINNNAYVHNMQSSNNIIQHYCRMKLYKVGDLFTSSFATQLPKLVLDSTTTSTALTGSTTSGDVTSGWTSRSMSTYTNSTTYNACTVDFYVNGSGWTTNSQCYYRLKQRWR